MNGVVINRDRSQDIFIPCWRPIEEDYERFTEEERQKYNIKLPRTFEVNGVTLYVTHRNGGIQDHLCHNTYVYNSEVDKCPDCGGHVAREAIYNIGDKVCIVFECDANKCQYRSKPVVIDELTREAELLAQKYYNEYTVLTDEDYNIFKEIDVS